MKEIIIDNMSYELIKDVRDGFNIEQVKSKKYKLTISKIN